MPQAQTQSANLIKTGAAGSPVSVLKASIFCKKKMEQAGIGQWPYSLAVCAANEVVSILRECYMLFRIN